MVSTNLWPNRKQSKDHLGLEDCQASTKDKIPKKEKKHHDIITRSSKRIKEDQTLLESNKEIPKKEKETTKQVTKHTLLVFNVEIGVQF